MKKYIFYGVLSIAIGALLGESAVFLLNKKEAKRFPAAVLTSPSTINKYLPLIRIKNNKDGSQCSATVLSSYYAATAGHCLIDEDAGKLKKDTFSVYDAHGTDTHVIASVAGASGQVDYGLIYADFSEFQSVPSNTNEPELLMSAQMPHIMCGFPMGRKEYLCSPFNPTNRFYFFVRGEGFSMPGMSGGGVFNSLTGTIDAVISGVVEDGEAVVAPIFAIFSAFNIEMQ